ncbi:DUF2690 domain-containing protein [Kitasatospora sp. NPDC056327]|uniref:helix-turn-helix domain-containing protein n=1 Tax=Kitasatospora sp. NPDC056327 TaxID=3345785 RepID=UPI0035D9E272
MGSAWKQLPDDLSAPARRLTEELRAVKDTTGLSLSELATRTHYSRASWERWLNGKRVITEQALEALIGAVECDGPALRALWERTAAEPDAEAEAAPEAEAEAEAVPEAESVTDAGAAAGAGTDTAPEAEPATDPEPAADPAAAPADGTAQDPADRRTTVRPAALVAASVVVALLLALAGMRYLSSSDGVGTEPAAATVPPTAPASPGPTTSSPAAVPANPAPAVPACQALGCAHKDPKTTGCGGDARTLLTTNVGKVVVYLRYSQKCQAAWAAITEGQPGDQAIITTGSGETETALIHWGYDNYSWMVNAADPAVTVRVCGQRKEPEGTSCTDAVADLARVVLSNAIPIGPASPPAAATTEPAAPTGTTPAAGTPGATEPAQPSPGQPGQASPSAT